MARLPRGSSRCAALLAFVALTSGCGDARPPIDNEAQSNSPQARAHLEDVSARAKRIVSQVELIPGWAENPFLIGLRDAARTAAARPQDADFRGALFRLHQSAEPGFVSLCGLDQHEALCQNEDMKRIVSVSGAHPMIARSLTG